MASPSETPPQDSRNSDSNNNSNTQKYANATQNNDETEYPTAPMQAEYRNELLTTPTLIKPGTQRTLLTARIKSRLQLRINHLGLKLTVLADKSNPQPKNASSFCTQKVNSKH